MGEAQGTGLVTEQLHALKSFSTESKWVIREGPPLMPQGANLLPGTQPGARWYCSLLVPSTDESWVMLWDLLKAGGRNDGDAVESRCF